MIGNSPPRISVDFHRIQLPILVKYLQNADFYVELSKKIHINFKKGVDKMRLRMYNRDNVQEMHEKEEVYNVH